MALNLVSDVFEPVAMHIKSLCDSGGMCDFLRERYEDRIPPTGGFKRWFGEQVDAALGDRVKEVSFRGLGLVLHDGTSTMEVELRAAIDLRAAYLRDGVKKYRGRQNFAGCLFLGDGSNDRQIKKLSDGNVELRESLTIEDGERKWIVGLLTSTPS